MRTIVGVYPEITRHKQSLCIGKDRLPISPVLPEFAKIFTIMPGNTVTSACYNLKMNEKTPLKIIVGVFILCVLCISGIGECRERDSSPDKTSVPDIDITQLENKIHALINKERAKRGLPALLRDKSLSKVARQYSQDMVERNFFSHNDPDGRSFYDRYKTAGFECSIRRENTSCMGAENIAQSNLFSSYFYKDGKTFFNWSTEDKIAESVVKQWMSSKGHKANILTPYFKRQGIGAAFSDDGKVYITENFC